MGRRIGIVGGGIIGVALAHRITGMGLDVASDAVIIHLEGHCYLHVR